MLTVHPPGQTDSFILFVKGAVILSLVKNFNLRWDAPYMHSSKARPDPRSMQSFGNLDKLLIEFEAGINSFHFLVDRRVDQHLLLAHATPFVYVSPLNHPP